MLTWFGRVLSVIFLIAIVFVTVRFLIGLLLRVR